MSEPLRIAVADDERDTRQFFQEVLTHLGHQVVVAAETGGQLVAQCRPAEPDLVITDAKMSGLDGIDAAEAINSVRPVPVILVTAHPDAALVKRASAAGVMAYLVKPVKPAELEAAITLAVARFEELRKANREAAGLRRALEDRKVIERAKGVATRRLGVDEAEAFQRMRDVASVHNRKLVEVSQSILDAERVFRELERLDTAG
jgi:response regulator NasT